MKIYANRGVSGLTIGQLYDLLTIPGKTSVLIYDDADRDNVGVIWDGDFKECLREYPELTNAQVRSFSPIGNYRLSIHTIAGFDYTPAW